MGNFLIIFGINLLINFGLLMQGNKNKIEAQFTSTPDLILKLKFWWLFEFYLPSNLCKFFDVKVDNLLSFTINNGGWYMVLEEASWITLVSEEKSSKVQIASYQLNCTLFRRGRRGKTNLKIKCLNLNIKEPVRALKAWIRTFRN